jgi:hypothetical protein
LILYHKLDIPEAKANLTKAKELFDMSKIIIQEIYYFETSKEDPSTLDAMLNKVNEILLKIEGV